MIFEIVEDVFQLFHYSICNYKLLAQALKLLTYLYIVVGCLAFDNFQLSNNCFTHVPEI